MNAQPHGAMFSGLPSSTYAQKEGITVPRMLPTETFMNHMPIMRPRLEGRGEGGRGRRGKEGGEG